MGIARRWRVGMAFLIAIVSIPGSLAVSAESDPAARPLPAGSTGVTVVDFAAFKRSELFKNLAPLPDGEQMSVWGEEYGFEPFRSLDGITVIMGGGGRPGAESWNGVVLSGTFAATTLAAKMKESAGDASTTERYREHTIHVVPSSPEADEALKKRDRVLTRGIFKVDMGVPHLSYVVFVGDHTLVGSQSKQGLVKMLDWFDRRGEALPPEQAAVLLPPQENGAIFSVALTAEDPNWNGIVIVGEPTGKAAQQEDRFIDGLTSIAFTAGEADRQSFVVGRVTCKNAEIAGQIKAMADGFGALMALQNAQVGADADTVEGRLMALFGKFPLQVVKENATLKASLRFPSDDVMALFKLAGESNARQAVPPGAQQPGPRRN